MRLPFNIFRRAEDPILEVRTHYWDRSRSGLLVVLVVMLYLMARDLGQPIHPIHEGESETTFFLYRIVIVIVCLLLMWMLWQRYMTFDRKGLMVGYRIGRGLFLRPRVMSYAEIRYVILTHHLFMPAIHFGPTYFRGTNIILARGFSEESLKPVLLLLKERAGIWTFDDNAKKLLEKFEAEEARPRRMDE